MTIPIQSSPMVKVVGIDGQTSLVERDVLNEAHMAAFDRAFVSSKAEMQSAILKIRFSVPDGFSL
jgi:hypothetical protein